MNEFIGGLKKYTVFSGRSSRKEFWMYTLFYLIFALILGVIAGLLGDQNGILVSLYGLALLLPTLAMVIRRLHDTNRSGWYILIGLIPLVGSLILLYFYVQDSTPGQNQYGPNPKGANMVS